MTNVHVHLKGSSEDNWMVNSRVTPLRSPAWKGDIHIVILCVTTKLPSCCVLMHHGNKILPQTKGLLARIGRVEVYRFHSSIYSKCVCPSF